MLRRTANPSLHYSTQAIPLYIHNATWSHLFIISIVVRTVVHVRNHAFPQFSVALQLGLDAKRPGGWHLF